MCPSQRHTPRCATDRSDGPRPPDTRSPQILKPCPSPSHILQPHSSREPKYSSAISRCPLLDSVPCRARCRNRHVFEPYTGLIPPSSMNRIHVGNASEPSCSSQHGCQSSTLQNLTRSTSLSGHNSTDLVARAQHDSHWESSSIALTHPVGTTHSSPSPHCYQCIKSAILGESLPTMGPYQTHETIVPKPGVTLSNDGPLKTETANARTISPDRAQMVSPRLFASETLPATSRLDPECQLTSLPYRGCAASCVPNLEWLPCRTWDCPFTSPPKRGPEDSHRTKRPRLVCSSTSTTNAALSYLFSWLLLLSLYPVEVTAAQCRMKYCDFAFARSLEAKKLLSGPNLPYCLNLQRYYDCLAETRLPCRGNLRFHAMFTVTKRHMNKNNCSEIVAADEARTLKRGKTAREPASFAASSANTIDEKVSDAAASSHEIQQQQLRPQSDAKSFPAGSRGSDPTLLQVASGPAYSVDTDEPFESSDNQRCLFPYHHDSATTGFRHCGVWGDPHLRTFSGQQETCRLLGAWPLVDNAYFAVQATNEALIQGATPSAVTKITVIIRSLPGCTGQKTYEATSTGLPSAFVDGSSYSATSAGDVFPDYNAIPDDDSPAYSPDYGVDTNSAEQSDEQRNNNNNKFNGRTGSNNDRRRSRQPPPGTAVHIRPIVAGEHIQIRLRYIATTISIRRAGAYLSFSLRIPEEIVRQSSGGAKALLREEPKLGSSRHDSSPDYDGAWAVEFDSSFSGSARAGIGSASGLQLCVSGCPPAERIPIKEVLADPNTHLRHLHVAAPTVGRSVRVDRERAAEICRDAGTTDSYFDACVFDVLVSGDPVFALASARALSDVRTLYPAYTRHYETNRTSLDIYDSFATPGRRGVPTTGRHLSIDVIGGLGTSQPMAAPSHGSSIHIATPKLSPPTVTPPLFSRKEGFALFVDSLIGGFTILSHVYSTRWLTIGLVLLVVVAR